MYEYGDEKHYKKNLLRSSSKKFILFLEVNILKTSLNDTYQRTKLYLLKKANINFN